MTSCACSAPSGVMGMMEKLGVDEDTPIEQKMLTNAIENAQKQVESRQLPDP